jgi:SAM-dependent methyltransferase
MTEDLLNAEAARIRAEYRRRGHQKPAILYTFREPSTLFFRQGLSRACLKVLECEGIFPLWSCRIADIGCGSGTWLLEFLQWGADAKNLSGMDLDAERIAKARNKIPGADWRTGDARNLPWPDDSFDLVTQFTLFTSILNEPFRKSVAAEMLRVLKPGGRVLWYDFRFNNPGNDNVRGIGAREIRSLFPGCMVKLRSETLAPPIARCMVPISWILSLCLEQIPFLRTHYLATIRKPARQGAVEHIRA